MERGNEWSVRVTRGIGKRVAYYRERADLPASMLSARCASLGLPLDRNVIAKLENGHRNSVTVDEVIVLATALEVPPVMLLFGVGIEETAEVLPGNHAPAFDAAEWFSGEGPAPGLEAARAPGRKWVSEPLTLYRDYARHLAGEASAWETAAEIARDAETAGPERRALLSAALDGARELARQHHDRASEARERLERGGWLPPAIPGEGK
jgi:transcriptional regulator with XRE-family HTH domain